MSHEPRPPLPQIPGAPDPNRPVPREPVSGIDLPAYAAIAARLAEGTEPPAVVLARSGLTESQWTSIEQTWLLRIAVAALQEDRALVSDYERLYVEAQDALGPPGPSRTLDEYAAIVARIESGHAPPRVLKEAGLSVPDWGRLMRAWIPRIAADPALGDHFRARVASLKKTP